MCNTFIPIATLPTAVLRFAAADPGTDAGPFVRTDKQAPIATLPSPVVRSPGPASVALCQNRQASANSYVSCTSRCPGDAGPFVRTDKQAPTDQGLQAHCCITNSCVAVCCCGLDPWEDALLSEQTSKRPVNKGFQSLPYSYIIRTSRCGPGRPGKLLSEQTSKQLFTGYSQFMAKLSTALPHELSSVAQEPWSPVHMGSVFSPWTTNDSTWDA